MNKNNKVILILLAYNAEETLERFYKSLPRKLIDEIILVDDASKDKTFKIAQKLGINSYRNAKNLGYGGNLKRALGLALSRGGEIIIDIHPDGEYSPDSIPDALEKIKQGAKLVLGNRFHDLDYIFKKSGMYFWKIVFIRTLNIIDKLILGVNLNDFHQGFRVYTKSLLEKINFEENSNNYLFSFELIAQAIFNKAKIAEVPVKTKYAGKKRGASFKSSIIYSLNTFRVLTLFILARKKLKNKIFQTPKKNLKPRIDNIPKVIQ